MLFRRLCDEWWLTVLHIAQRVTHSPLRSACRRPRSALLLGLFLPLIHSFVVSKEGKKKSCQRCLAQWDRWIGWRKTRARFCKGIKELNSAWLSIAWWWWISLMAGFKKEAAPARAAYLWFLSQWSLYGKQQGRREWDKDEKMEGRRGSVSFVRRRTHQAKAKRRKWESVKNGWGKA